MKTITDNPVANVKVNNTIFKAFEQNLYKKTDLTKHSLKNNTLKNVD